MVVMIRLPPNSKSLSDRRLYFGKCLAADSMQAAKFQKSLCQTLDFWKIHACRPLYSKSLSARHLSFRKYMAADPMQTAIFQNALCQMMIFWKKSDTRVPDGFPVVVEHSICHQACPGNREVV